MSSTVYAIVLALHILVSVLLIVAVLLQSGKGADIGAVFGGAGSQALFGSAGPADFLNKATRVLVVVFMLTSLTLGFSAIKSPGRSIMDKTPVTAPAAPAKAAPMTAAPPAAAPSQAAPAVPAPAAQAPAASAPAVPAPAAQAPAAPAPAK